MPVRPAGFDYATARRGYWAPLRDGAGRLVTLTEHPATLLSMARAGVLEGEAKREAEALRAAAGPAFVIPRGLDCVFL